MGKYIDNACSALKFLASVMEKIRGMHESESAGLVELLTGIRKRIEQQEKE